MPAPKPGESREGANDAAGTTSAEPLNPKAREALRSAFFGGASKANINDVYALGATIGAWVPPKLRCMLADERAGRNWRFRGGSAGDAPSDACLGGGEGAVVVNHAYRRERGTPAGAMQ